MDSGGPSRLNGWKEIAGYLGVTVRTAQLWEKGRGLPVHRLPGGGKPSVFATPAELELWIHRNPHDADSGAGRSETPDRRRARRLRLAVLVAFVILVSAVAIVRIPTGSSTLTGKVVSCTVSPRLVKALDATNRVVWQWSFGDMSTRHGNSISQAPRCIVRDVDGDGASEVVFLYLGQDRYGNDTRVICLAPGEEQSRWEHPLGRRLEKDGRVFPDAYIGTLIRPVELHGTLYIIVASRHSPSFPAEVVLLDARSGALVDRYSHPGHLKTMALSDFDRDGSDELLMGGINNPGPGPGRPVVVLLDLPFSGEQGQARQEEDFFGNPGPHELAYLALPRSDADEVTGVPAAVTEVGVSEEGLVTAVVSSPNGSLSYTLDLSDLRSPRIAGVTAQVSFQLGHDALADSGKLDHSLPPELFGRYFELAVFETAPDCNAP